MAGLHVRIVHGDKMIVNGAALHFLSNADLRIANKVRFIYGRQLMAPNDATTPARRIYFAVQNAYVGEPQERLQASAEARLLIGMFREATLSDAARRMLDRVLALIEAAHFYQALKVVERIIRHEDAVHDFAALTQKTAPSLYETFIEKRAY